jgi:hypothetical protein
MERLKRMQGGSAAAASAAPAAAVKGKVSSA